MDKYICVRPTHPGKVLKDEIEYKGISQTSLVKKMGMSYKVLNDILNERHNLTASTAMMFKAALGLYADSLMRIQLKYNMQIAQKDNKLKSRLDKIRRMAAML